MTSGVGNGCGAALDYWAVFGARVGSSGAMASGRDGDAGSGPG